MYFIASFSSWLTAAPEARCPLSAHVAPPLSPRSFCFLPVCTVNTLRWKLAGACRCLSFSSCDCLRSTKGKLRQAETASPSWTCHLRCVSYGHVAPKARPSMRELHNETPLDCSMDHWMIQPQPRSSAVITRSAWNGSTLLPVCRSPLPVTALPPHW